MADFGKFYLDKEKDIIVQLELTDGGMRYLVRTPNHAKGNLITNLARVCSLPLSRGDDGLKVIRGEVPCYIDERNREVYVLRLADTKVANIYPDGTIERKAYIPAISKTLMSQTKDYRLDVKKTLVKTYIRREYKFRTDLHTHMNANLDADLLIALGIFHQIRYPLYYIRKLRLRCTEEQKRQLEEQRKQVAKRYENSGLSGKYLLRKIDDNTTINFAALILARRSASSRTVRRYSRTSRRSISTATCSPKGSRADSGSASTGGRTSPTATSYNLSAGCARTGAIPPTTISHSFRTSCCGSRAACSAAAWCTPKSPTPRSSRKTPPRICCARCTS